MRLSTSLKYVLLISLLVILALVKLTNGSTVISWETLWQIFFDNQESSIASRIVWQVRLPALFTAVIVGAGLALAGLIMQTVFNNPLAGPSVLGLSAGADLGAAIVILTAGVGALAQIPASIIGSILILLLVITASSRVRSVVTLLVFGLMLGYLVGAVVSVLQLYANEEAISTLVFWGMGSFAGVYDWKLMMLALVVSLCCLAALFSIRALDAYLLGETQAASLGINVKRWRLIFIVIVGILTGIVTAFCGPIAFVGLAVPHMARLLFQSAKHSVLIPATILCGALVSLLAEIISSIGILTNGIPLNAVLSLIGAPVIIWLVMSRSKSRLV